MPGPPPPPPPPSGGLPPPPMFTPAKPAAGGDSRGALLKSIQKGTKLKKTTTIDKSAPDLGKHAASNIGRRNNSIQNGADVGDNGSTSSGRPTMPPAPQLAGLFSGGMPKLKSTGLLKDCDTSNSSSSTSNRRPSDTPRSFSSIQNELKKQLANDNNKSRGPPPPAPMRNFAGSDLQLHSHGNLAASGLDNSSPFRNSRSNSNLHNDSDSNFNADTSSPRSTGYRKPNVAPRPSQPNGMRLQMPPKKLNNGKVARAHSMRNNRSSSGDMDSPEIGGGGGGPPHMPAKFGTVRGLPSMESGAGGGMMGMGISPARSRPALNGRPTDPPPSIPGVQQLGGDGSFAAQLASRLHARQQSIPQPPSTPPPPPPHQRTLRQPPPIPAPPTMSAPSPTSYVLTSSAAAPPPPASLSSTSNVPLPPPRFSSIREKSVEFEARFVFHNQSEFPKPNVFKSIQKNYRLKTNECY